MPGPGLVAKLCAGCLLHLHYEGFTDHCVSHDKPPHVAESLAPRLQPTLGRPDARSVAHRARRRAACCPGRSQQAITQPPRCRRCRRTAAATAWPQALQPLQGVQIHISSCTCCKVLTLLHPCLRMSGMYFNFHLSSSYNCCRLRSVADMQVAKPRADFHRNRTTADGLQYQCRACHQEVRKWPIKHPHLCSTSQRCPTYCMCSSLLRVQCGMSTCA